MKTTLMMILLATLCFQCTSQNTIENEPELIKKSEKIKNMLIQTDYDGVTADFNSQMMEALKPAQLKQVWEGLIQQIGNYQSDGAVTSSRLQGYRVIYSILKFEKSPFKLKVVFDQEDQVAGLFLIPVNAK
ncbi:MAG: DUF3887 domain-containing protein [Bacteroidota bacterium]